MFVCLLLPAPPVCHRPKRDAIDPSLPSFPLATDPSALCPLVQVYHLTAVLVHIGQTPNGGHYVAHVRPTGSDQWYKFNDSTVTPLLPHEVREAAGGSHWPSRLQTARSC